MRVLSPVVRSTYHQNFLGESSKNQGAHALPPSCVCCAQPSSLAGAACRAATGTPKSAAMPYIFFCGMLMAQWSFTGYDSCVHMVEETHDAQMSGPAGIMRSLTINAMFGLALIISIIGSIQDYRNTYFGPLALNWNPVAQIMWDVFEGRTGDGRNACGFWGIIMTIFSACGMSCLTSNARMCYAFSRDGAIPGHKYWHTIDKKTGIPLNGIWFMAICAIAIAVPVCYSQTAYAAVTSITTIGLYISYATPSAFIPRHQDSPRRVLTASWRARSLLSVLPGAQPQGLRPRTLVLGRALVALHPHWRLHLGVHHLCHLRPAEHVPNQHAAQLQRALALRVQLAAPASHRCVIAPTDTCLLGHSTPSSLSAPCSPTLWAPGSSRGPCP